MLLIGLAVGGLGFKLATVGGVVLPDNGRGDGDCRDPDFPQSQQRDRALRHRVYCLAVLGGSDAGWDFWPLFSRLFTFAVLAFLCAIVWPFLRAANHSGEQGPLLASRPCSRWHAGQPWLDV
jgi:quinate dehydrogenase (quinone)